MLKIFPLDNEWFGRVYIHSVTEGSNVFVIEINIENDKTEYYFKDFVSSSVAFWEFTEWVKSGAFGRNRRLINKDDILIPLIEILEHRKLPISITNIINKEATDAITEYIKRFPLSRDSYKKY